MERELDIGEFRSIDPPEDIADIPSGRTKEELAQEIETLKQEVQKLKGQVGVSNERASNQ